MQMRIEIIDYLSHLEIKNYFPFFYAIFFQCINELIKRISKQTERR